MYLLILFLIIFPAFAESVPDYDDPYSPIFTDKSSYTWTDKVKMTIIAPSWNTNGNLIDSIGSTDEHFIKISTGEHFLKPYRFTETETNSGIFTAEIILTGFEHDANGNGESDTTPRTNGNGPTNGFLESDRDSAITISFEFADGVVLTESVPTSWNKGEIDFLGNSVIFDESVNFRVVDLDMNLNPETTDTIQIHIYSDSDVAGITIDAIETLDDSGMFVGSVIFSQEKTSSGNRLFAIPGDKITAKYDDYTLPKPYSISDNLKIETFTILDSLIPTIDYLENLPIKFSDSFGNEISSFLINQQMQIIGTIENNQKYDQNFVYLIQVKHKDNVEFISWVQGQLTEKQILDVSQSWTPRKAGTFVIETFVWKSLNNFTALSPVTSTLITVE